ncbi:hypothetical protein AAG570_012529 [Ranatra chinensis]|uniref:RING-type E3 ubiquitin transferase n=1 Tax=Ranatra chinensis TaxID=642074 RepID=A0ABD0Z2D2_9HEMI
MGYIFPNNAGVSCDSCLKGNFRGRRYKCLICYDYDLCATCYEAGATTTRHTTEHPMQCILTRTDFDLFYGGEALTGEQPQAFTCPYCGKMGYTELALQEHVTADHSEVSFEVVCPVCASLPVGDPNLVTDDFAGHLTLEHRNPTRDLISFLDEPSARHGGARRIPPPTSRGMTSSRTRRSNMHFSSSGALASISPSSRENVDPIAELLSQLSGVRRQGSTPSQLQHLQMQLQLERQQVRAARQQLERLPRRPGASQQLSAPIGSSPALGPSNLSQDTSPPHSIHLMLSRYLERSLSDLELEKVEQERADRSLFVQELMIATLSEVNSEETKNNLVGNSYTAGINQENTESVGKNTNVGINQLPIPPPVPPLRPTPRISGNNAVQMTQVLFPPRRKPVCTLQPGTQPPSH